MFKALTWKIKLAMILGALVLLGTPGFLGYRYVKGVIEDNKTLTTERDTWKQRATYWYQQHQAALVRIGDFEEALRNQQNTMNLLARNRSSATTTGRSVSNAFKQVRTALDASRTVNDAFGVLSCQTEIGRAHV